MSRLQRLAAALILPFLSVVGFVIWQFFRGGKLPAAALSINLSGPAAEVYLDGQLAGKTPFYSDTLGAGEVDARIASWSSRLTLTPGALTAVKLEFGAADPLTSAQILWLEKSEESKISVVSRPEDATVTINGQGYGGTPLSSPLSPGTYSVSVSKPGYITVSVRCQVQPGYKLNASFKLKARAVPEKLEPMDLAPWGLAGREDSLTVYDFSTPNEELVGDAHSWVLGISQYYSTHPDLTPVSYFLTPRGKVLDSSGSEVSEEWVAANKLAIAYLGKKGEEPSPEAKDGLVKFVTGALGGTVRLKILPTGVGFLRVRSGPGTSYSEVTKVTPGEEYPFLEESSGWYKIKLPDGRVGWISGRWARKIESR